MAVCFTYCSFVLHCMGVIYYLPPYYEHLKHPLTKKQWIEVGEFERPTDIMKYWWANPTGCFGECLELPAATSSIKSAIQAVTHFDYWMIIGFTLPLSGFPHHAKKTVFSFFGILSVTWVELKNFECQYIHDFVARYGRFSTCCYIKGHEIHAGLWGW